MFPLHQNMKTDRFEWNVCENTTQSQFGSFWQRRGILGKDMLVTDKTQSGSNTDVCDIISKSLWNATQEFLN